MIKEFSHSANTLCKYSTYQYCEFRHRMAELLKEMRYELDQLLAEKIQDPKLDLVTYGRGKLIIETIVHLISTE